MPHTQASQLIMRTLVINFAWASMPVDKQVWLTKKVILLQAYLERFTHMASYTPRFNKYDLSCIFLPVFFCIYCFY